MNRFNEQWQAQLQDGRVVKLATDTNNYLYTLLFSTNDPIPVRLGPHNSSLEEMIQKITNAFQIECNMSFSR